MISIIAAVSENNIIGAKGDLPWYLPEDLKRFKELTTGHIVLMGRKTYESIVKRIGKPLPHRTNVVISTDTSYKGVEGVLVFNSLEKALEQFKDQDIFIIGGGMIFHEGMQYADTLFITKVHKNVEGDTYFPEIDEEKWRELKRENIREFSFIEYRLRSF